MLISQPISRCLTNHSELCMSRLLNNQPRRISIYGLQRRPCFGFESSVSSTPMTSGDPVYRTVRTGGALCGSVATAVAGCQLAVGQSETVDETTVAFHHVYTPYTVEHRIQHSCKKRLNDNKTFLKSSKRDRNLSDVKSVEKRDSPILLLISQGCW